MSGRPGPEAGVAARYAWKGNRKAGKGSMEILESTPERVQLRLSFEKPWKATDRVVFELTPRGDSATEVTWRMTIKGIATVFGKLLGMDRLIGRNFERASAG